MAHESPVPPLGSSLTRDLLQPGSRIANYEVTELLSFGMTGGVYRAKAITDDEPCILWVVPSLLGKDTNFRRRMQAAMPNMLSLRHPNILQVQRLTWQDDLGLMELAPFNGHTLEQQLLSTKEEHWPPLGEQELKTLLGGLLEALAAGHQRSMCHHNLVPGTILLREDMEPVVIGFGIVDLMGRDLYQKLASAAVPPLKVPEMAYTLSGTDLRCPEIQGGQSPTRASDIYDFGLLSYFLLAGTRYSSTAAKPSEARPGLSQGWDAFSVSCLQPDPAKRPQVPLRLLDELHAIGEPPASAVKAAKKARRRAAKRAIDPTAPGPQKGKKLVLLGLLLVALSGAAVWQFGRNWGAASGPMPLSMTANVDPVQVHVEGPEVHDFELSGRMVLQTAPGEYTVTASASGFQNEQQQVKLGKDGASLRLDLAPAISGLKIQTEPGAEAYVVDNGTTLYLGQADENGSLDLSGRLLAGPRRLLIRAEGYAPQDLELNLTPGGGDRAVDLPLQAVNSQLTLNARPAGAQVYLDGTLLGTAPLDPLSVAAGEKRWLRVTKNGYRPYTSRIDLKAGEPLVVDVPPLEPEQGFLVVSPEFAVPGGSTSDVTLTIDGKSVPVGQPVELVPGRVEFRVESPDYLPYSGQADVRDRQTVRLTALLQPKPGKVILDLDPADVDVQLFLNGERVPARLTDGVSVPSGRDVTLELRAQNYLTLRQSLRVKPNEERTITLKMAPIPGPEKGQNWTLPYLGQTFLWLSPGSFVMGSPREEVENRPNESPRTRVMLTEGFWIMPTEVTQSFWKKLMPENRSLYIGDQLPVQLVSWEDAMEFCGKLNKREREAGRLPDGYAYRLPTDAEWEYAARAGTGTPFSWGKIASGVEGRFRRVYPRDFDRVATSIGPAFAGPVSVASYPANGWGLHDMHGNMAEWCANLFNARLPGGTVTNWTGPEEGRDRAVRGGSWGDVASRCRSAARERFAQDVRSSQVGFRVVLAPAISEE